MTNNEIYSFFNSTENIKFDKDLLLNLLKEKFGFPIIYTPEGMDQPLVLSAEESVQFYKKFETRILLREYSNICELNNQIFRELDLLYDSVLDI